MLAKLSVNINKIAVLRNSRGGSLPDLFQVARDLESFGAEGITVHPRPDERHIRYSDLQPLKDLVQTEFNIEGYPDERFLTQVLAICPHQCTLVPDPPGVLTSDSGWDTVVHANFLKAIVLRLQAAGIRVSLFVNADVELIEAAAATGTNRIELYTGDYAIQFGKDRETAIAPHILAANAAARLGLGLNAGHDLNIENLQFYASNITNLAEVSIGHALICDALYLGLHNTVQLYLRALEG